MWDTKSKAINLKILNITAQILFEFRATQVESCKFLLNQEQ
jgi:hypothetical protein